MTWNTNAIMIWEILVVSVSAQVAGQKNWVFELHG